jgi:hypothetical protein
MDSIEHFDRFSHREAFNLCPYILLNLMLSVVAALQTPLMMMPQKRQAAEDRLGPSLIQTTHEHGVDGSASHQPRSGNSKTREFQPRRMRLLSAQFLAVKHFD